MKQINPAQPKFVNGKRRYFTADQWLATPPTSAPTLASSQREWKRLHKAKD